MIDAPGLAEVFIDLIVRHGPPRLHDSIFLRGSVVTSKFWPFLCCCLGVKQTTIRSSSSLTGLKRCYATSWCRYRLIHPGFSDSIGNNWDSAFISRFWAPRYYFRAQLQLPPMHLWEHQLGSHDCMQKESSALACEIANPFPPDLWGYVHGFCYQPARCLVKGLISTACILHEPRETIL